MCVVDSCELTDCIADSLDDTVFVSEISAVGDALVVSLLQGDELDV